MGGLVNSKPSRKLAKHVVPMTAVQVKQVGKQRLVLDLSCRKRDGKYYVVTDRWQRFSELVVDAGTLSSLGKTLCVICSAP